MKNIVRVEVRRFPLLVVKQDNQEVYERHIVLTKEQLHAAQVVGQSSKELISRICKKQGYEVKEIGKAEKRTLEVDYDFWWSAYDFVRECEGGGN